jgi:hypothetical protein
VQESRVLLQKVPGENFTRVFVVVVTLDLTMWYVELCGIR